MILINDNKVCPKCGGYSQNNGFCTNGHFVDKWVTLEEFKYYSCPIWDYEKISKLIPMAKGRLKKVLEKLWRFDGAIRSMKEQIEYEWKKGEITDKYITNNMWKWNRRKYNQMMGDEQYEYEAKLIAGRTYNISIGNNICRTIPKTLFDVLNLKDVTDIEKLEH